MPKQYTTVQGDTFDMIARDQLGSEKRMDLLLKANPEYHGVVVFTAGVRLAIPDVTVSEQKGPVPPWQK